jgi:hypothetical protein
MAGPNCYTSPRCGGLSRGVNAGDSAQWPGCAGPRAEGVIDIERSTLNLIKSIYVTASRTWSVSVIKLVSNHPVLGFGFLQRGD